MALRYLILCPVYLILLQSAVMAEGYTDDNDPGGKKTEVTTDLPGSSPANDAQEGSVYSSGDITETSLNSTDEEYRKLRSILNADTSNPYPGGYNPYLSPYNGNPRIYPEPSHFNPPKISPGVYPTSSLYPGFPGINTPPISKDYVSRYQGPGTVPVVLPDGTLADTPEVIAARAAHLTALERAQVLWYGPKDDGSYNPIKYEGPRGYATPGYTGPLISGPSADHHGAGYLGPLSTGYRSPGFPGAPVTGYSSGSPVPVYAGSPVAGYSSGSPVPGYAGSPVSGYSSGSPVTGYAGSPVAGYSSGSPVPVYPGSPAAGYSSGSPVPGYAGSPVAGYTSDSITGYRGPTALPTVLPSGYLADTSEVVAAKLAHLNAVFRANEEHAALWRTGVQSQRK